MLDGEFHNLEILNCKSAELNFEFGIWNFEFEKWKTGKKK